MKHDPTMEFSGELTLDKQSSKRLLQLMSEQDREFLDAVFAGKCGFTLNSIDGRSVELAPVEEGEWIDVNDGFHLNKHKCSKCGVDALTYQCQEPNGCTWEEDYLTEYCPHCGRRMKKKGIE